MQNFDIDDFNILDMNAKKVIETLSFFKEVELVKGDQIHKKTSPNSSRNK